MSNSENNLPPEKQLERVHMTFRRTGIVELAFSSKHHATLSRFLAAHGFTLPPPTPENAVQHVSFDPAFIDADRLESLALEYANSQEAFDAIRASA